MVFNADTLLYKSSKLSAFIDNVFFISVESFCEKDTVFADSVDVLCFIYESDATDCAESSL